ncbi:uncharacterized protein LOC132731404 [Ruditapes philippinarum]|uniref:uncharacterized protein LOC132731404 n=1 Tax=Ruditapes philippinarum TaxID=129788 RepID=UPI00295AB2D7|nr:uncharacterized protein LOC132731404 [Ruditapes philippinarum]
MDSSGKKKDESEDKLNSAAEANAQLYCESCNKDGIRLTPQGYCQNCMERDNCYKTHREPSPNAETDELERGDMVGRCKGLRTDGGCFEILTIKYSEDIDVQIPSDKYDCSIPGATVIAKDIVSLCDFSNSSVKIVDTQLKKTISEKALPDCPDNLALLPNDILAVTLSDMKTIAFLSIPTELTEVRRLEVDGNCKDLVYHDNKLIVAFEWPGKVQIMDLDGHVYKSVEKDFYGNELKSPYVTHGAKKNIYISDSIKSTITSMNLNGEILKGYKDERLVEPCGMVVLDDGSILVCSSGNNKILLISENLETTRVILEEKDGLYCPWSLTLDREQNKLYVGSGKKCNFLNVYDVYAEAIV